MRNQTKNHRTNSRNNKQRKKENKGLIKLNYNSLNQGWEEVGWRLWDLN